MRRSSTTIVFMLFVLFSTAQHLSRNDYNIPSLRRVRNDTTKINILLEKIGLKYENINPDSSIYFYTLALKIAQNSPQALANHGKLKKKFQHYEVVSYRYIGIIYRTKGLFDKAIKNYIKALKIAEKLKDKELKGILYVNIGNVLYEQKSYSKASWYYNKSLGIDKELNHRIGVSEGYMCLSRNYLAQKQYKTAMMYSQLALKLATEIKYTNGLAFCYSNIGLIEEGQKLYGDALLSYEKALSYAIETDDMNAESSIYSYLSGLYLAMSNDPKLSSTDKEYNLKKVLEYGEKGFETALILKSFSLQNSLAKSMQLANTKLKRYDEALKYAQIYIATNDSIYQENKIRVTAELELKYKSKNDQLEIEKLAKDSELQQSKINKQNIILAFLIGVFVLILIFLFLVLRLFRQKRKASLEIETQRDEILQQHEVLVNQSTLITDSFNYAKRLQQGIFPSTQYLNRVLGQHHFTLLKPKDIVSGDFYWATRMNEFLIVAVADCTGHGVPGALMSMLATSNLNEIVRHQAVKNAAKILDALRDLIIDALNQKGNFEEQKDGLDIALCVINTKTLEMQYSGAFLPCIIIKNSNKELVKINGDRMPIGLHPEMTNFTNHLTKLEKGDFIYLMSDGYQDQFGGSKNSKFLPKRTCDLLLSIQSKSMDEQKEILDQTIEDWKNYEGTVYEQTDDITVLGFKVDFE